MDFPRPARSAGEIFSDLKDKLSFRDRDIADEAYYDSFDNEENAGDYGPYGYDSDADYYDDFDDGYDDFSTQDFSNDTRHRTYSPQLVSSEDVRATTSVHGVTTRPRTTVTATSSFRPSVDTSRFRETNDSHAGYDRPATAYHDFVSPYSQHAMSGDAAYSARTSTNEFSHGEPELATNAPSRSTGLDSLFTPTATSDTNAALQDVSSKDPYEAFEHNTGFLHTPSRSITVIKPVKYDDIQAITAALRGGNVVVLVLRVTGGALAKRVLDFSFGVASALDARVECIAEKVFVVARGAELSLEEKHELRKQVML